MEASLLPSPTEEDRQPPDTDHEDDEESASDPNLFIRDDPD